jgi:hypothetical protein
LADYTKHHVGEPWEQADLFFLVDALARGMSIAEVAAFLGRTEEEVREQSKATKHPHARAFSVSSGFSTKGMGGLL